MRSLTYDVDALGQVMAWSLGHWMIATVILGVIVSRLAHHNDIDHSGAGKVLLAYFGNGLVFVFLSCFIMAIEFAIMFDSPSSFQTDRMPIGPLCFGLLSISFWSWSQLPLLRNGRAASCMMEAQLQPKSFFIAVYLLPCPATSACKSEQWSGRDSSIQSGFTVSTKICKS